MPPRRSSRRQSAAYKKGDLVEFNRNGSTAKGKLVRKSAKGSTHSPLWVVCIDSRRRKNEEISEKALGRLIRSSTEVAPTQPKRLRRSSTRDTAFSYSDGSIEDDVLRDSSHRTASTRGTRRSATDSGSSEENSESSKKLKSDEATSSITNSRKSRRVTFQDVKQAKKKVIKVTSAHPAAPMAAVANTYGTRSTRTSGVELLSELPRLCKLKNTVKAAALKAKKSDNVKVIKLLTGTLYLYRGETRRAEFVRCKY